VEPSRIRAEDVQALVETPGLPALESLRLWADQEALGDVLATSALCRRLRRLWLLGSALDGTGFEGLCRLLEQGRLIDLHLPCCVLRRGTLAQLSACAGLSRLKRLSLCESRGVGKRGLRALLTSPHLDGLTSLDLRDCRLGDMVEALLGARLPNLTWLMLEKNGIKEASAEHLFAFRRERPDVYICAGLNEFHAWRQLNPVWCLSEDEDTIF
jgi:hypothetical protein